MGLGNLISLFLLLLVRLFRLFKKINYGILTCNWEQAFSLLFSYLKIHIPNAFDQINVHKRTTLRNFVKDGEFAEKRDIPY